MSHGKGNRRKSMHLRKFLAVKPVLNKIHLIIIIIVVTGHGDVTYNLRRSILGAISVGGKISYHLYNFSTSKASNNIMKLIRKSKWHSQYSTKESI